MPLFEFVCQDCGEAFEELVNRSTKVACPACQSSRVEKQLSVFAAGSSTGDEAPPCYTGQNGCALGKCGSGRCGIE